MVFVFCCDSGFYRFTLACASFIWPSPRALGLRFELLACASFIGLRLIHLAFALSSWLALRAFGLCLVHWLAPRSLACASFIGLRLVHWFAPRSAGLLLTFLSRAPLPCPCLTLLGQVPRSCPGSRSPPSIWSTSLCRDRSLGCLQRKQRGGDCGG